MGGAISITVFRVPTIFQPRRPVRSTLGIGDIHLHGSPPDLVRRGLLTKTIDDLYRLTDEATRLFTVT